jgi:hypothetical protein
VYEDAMLPLSWQTTAHWRLLNNLRVLTDFPSTLSAIRLSGASLLSRDDQQSGEGWALIRSRGHQLKHVSELGSYHR